jgi:hypothetical protein
VRLTRGRERGVALSFETSDIAPKRDDFRRGTDGGGTSPASRNSARHMSSVSSRRMALHHAASPADEGGGGIEPVSQRLATETSPPVASEIFFATG